MNVVTLLNQACLEPLTGYVSTDSELSESLKHLCTQDINRPGRTALQDIAEEAEGTQPDHDPKDGAVSAD